MAMSGGTRPFRANAAAMASYGKPDQQEDRPPARFRVAGTRAGLQRDSDKPLFIDTLRVFGSYLNPEVVPWVTSILSSRTADGLPTRRRCRTRPGPADDRSIRSWFSCCDRRRSLSSTLSNGRPSLTSRLRTSPGVPADSEPSTASTETRRPSRRRLIDPSSGGNKGPHSSLTPPIQLACAVIHETGVVPAMLPLQRS